MNNPNMPPFQQNRNNPPLDKTIDEANVRHSQVGINPYAQQNQMPSRYYQLQQLPTGKEKIPLGSGSIVGLLGSGGMARVYKIWNEKLEIFRAVKILLPNSQRDLSGRFETEAKITAQLNHINIVEIYNIGEWNGLPYLEMELIEGLTLERLIAERGILPDQVVLAILMQVVSALEYAHNREYRIYGKKYQGIIHRDLKPANIMISKAGIVKLMDFGIARPTESGLHTTDGHIVGTLQYLSPEQLDGVNIDNRSDIYSLGAIIYEMMTGTKTFPQATITNLMKMKATNAFRKFSEFDFSPYAPLVKITEKCLQQKCENRYQNAESIARDLEKAYTVLTKSEPSALLSTYFLDPLLIENAASAKTKKIKTIAVISGASALICTVILFLIFHQSPKTPTQKTTKTPVSVQEKTVKTQASKAIDDAQTIKPVPAQQVEASDALKNSQFLDSVIAARRTSTVQNSKNLNKVDKTKSTNTTPPLPQQNKQNQLAKNTNMNERAIKDKGKIRENQLLPETNDEPNMQSQQSNEIKVLQERYTETDLLSIGEKACKAGDFRDAITALTKVESDHPQNDKKKVYLLWAYLELNRYSNARAIATSLPLSDGFCSLLMGRLELMNENMTLALDLLESALTKPSLFQSPPLIRKEALYYIAQIRDKQFRENPLSDTRKLAMAAWNSVKMIYQQNPENTRFKEANKKLSSF